MVIINGDVGPSRCYQMEIWWLALNGVEVGQSFTASPGDLIEMEVRPRVCDTNYGTTYCDQSGMEMIQDEPVVLAVDGVDVANTRSDMYGSAWLAWTVSGTISEGAHVMVAYLPGRQNWDAAYCARSQMAIDPPSSTQTEPVSIRVPCSPEGSSLCIDGFINQCLSGYWVPTTVPCTPPPNGDGDGVDYTLLILAAGLCVAGLAMVLALKR